MAKKSKQTKASRVDPELERQLRSAPENAPIQAVFTLRSPAGEATRSAAATRNTVRKIVKKAASDTQSESPRVQVFPNVQSFSLEGSRKLVGSLLENEEIEAAMANVQSEDMLIRPVRSRPAASKPKGLPRARKRKSE